MAQSRILRIPREFLDFLKFAWRTLMKKSEKNDEKIMIMRTRVIRIRRIKKN